MDALPFCMRKTGQRSYGIIGGFSVEHFGFSPLLVVLPEMPASPLLPNEQAGSEREYKHEGHRMS